MNADDNWASKPAGDEDTAEEGMDPAEFARHMEEEDCKSRELDRWVRLEIEDCQKRPWWMFGIRTLVY